MARDRVDEKGKRQAVFAVAVDPKGEVLATGSLDGCIRLWSVPRTIARGLEAAGAGDALIATLTGHQGAVLTLGWSINGVLASGSDDQSVIIWKPVDGRYKIFRRLAGQHASDVMAVEWSPDGTRLATASLDKAVLLWDAAFNVARKIVCHHGFVKGLAWGPRYLASQSDDRTVRLHDPGESRPALTIRAPLKRSLETTFVTRCSWSPDGKLLAIPNAHCGREPAVVLAEDNGSSELALVGHGCAVAVAAFCPRLFEGERLFLASGDQDGAVSVWTTGKTEPVLALRRLFKHTVLALAWVVRDQGTVLFASSYDGSIALLAFGALLGKPVARERGAVVPEKDSSLVTTVVQLVWEDRLASRPVASQGGVKRRVVPELVSRLPAVEEAVRRVVVPEAPLGPVVLRTPDVPPRIVQCRGDEVLEGTNRKGTSKVSLLRGETVVWAADIGGTVSHLASLGDSFVVAAGDRLIWLSRMGRRLLPALHLDGPVTYLQQWGTETLAVTARATLSVWDFGAHECRAVLSFAHLAKGTPELAAVRYGQDSITISLSSAETYSYDRRLRVWMSETGAVHEQSLPAAQNARERLRQCLALDQHSAGLALAVHLEERLALARMGSPEEAARVLSVYAESLAAGGQRGKLRELFVETMQRAEPCDAVLAAVASNRALQDLLEELVELAGRPSPQ